jgi:23S rRNA (uracil-5-)-methyltransferase RumA
VKKGELLELTIDYNKYPNVGVGSIDGKRIYVKNAIEGQRISARYQKSKGGRYEAKLLEVLERSPIEKDSFCEHFNECGGCMLQTFDYDGQKNLKLKMVQNLFEEAGFDVPLTEVISSPEAFEYRNKMEFSFGDSYKGGPLTLGMHKKGRHNDVVTVDHCHLADEDYRTILRGLLDYFVKIDAPKYNKHIHEGFLKHLVVRKGKTTGEIMVALSASTQVPFDGKAFVDVLKNMSLKGTLESILYVKNDGLGDVVSGEIEVLYGRDYILDSVMGLNFKINLYSFFQTNTLGANLLYETAIQMIPDLEGKVCFDLFSGTGTIGQIMAQKAKKVIGIEIVKDAVEAAKENAAMNGIDNCTFLCGDVFEVLTGINDKPDVIVVDPPRNGIGEKTVVKVASYDIPEIVYVSCNPKTLMEDLAVFNKQGYEVTKMVLVDMFPWTGHVEVVSQIIKK